MPPTSSSPGPGSRRRAEPAAGGEPGRPSPRAVLFDLDGVLTPTATLHERAWKQTFDQVLSELAPSQPGFDREDYLRHVDGKPRYDGVRDFLGSRGIHPDEGRADDPPGWATVRAIGNAKDVAFRRLLAQHGIEPYPDAVSALDALTAAGKKLAVVSSSANATAVLAAAGLADRFEVVVDGVERRRRGLRGKPAPDTFLEAARRLGEEPSGTAVVEDAASGVAAASEGRFRPVVGVDRTGAGEGLRAAGADVVVSDLEDLPDILA